MKNKLGLVLIIFSLTVFLILCLSLASCQTVPGASASDSQTESRDAAASAGHPEKEPDLTEISLWTYPIGNWSNSTMVASLLADFNKQYPHIRVSVKYLDYNTGDSLMEDAIAKGQAPDIVFEGPERLCANWGDRGLMADLSQLWSSSSASQIYDHVQTACQSENGAYYIFPVCESAHCMAIHHDLFEAAGALQYLDEETHTWTTEGFIKAVAALKEYGVEQVGAVYCGGQAGDQGTRALVNNLYGGSFTDPEHSYYTINTPENIEALQLLYDLEGIDFAPDMTGADEVKRFSSGDLAMTFCWNVAREINETLVNPDLNFDVFPMAFPSPTGVPVLEGGIWGFGIFDNGDATRIEAAKTFVDFMTGTDSQYAKTVLSTTYWPVRPMEDLYVNDRLMTEYGTFTQYMSDYHQITPGWTEARTAWWKMLQEIGSGGDIEAAAKAFDDTANESAGHIQTE